MQIANVLLNNLLGISETLEETSPPTSKLGELVLKWADIEQAARELARVHLPKDKPLHVPLASIVDGLVSKKILSGDFRSRLEKVRKARNALVHGISVPPESELIELNSELDKLKLELS